MKKIINKDYRTGWGDYKSIARRLNEKHPDLDVMMLHRERLVELARNLPDHEGLTGKPDTYTLDDIRFEWFFIKKGQGENQFSWRLTGNF